MSEDERLDKISAMFADESAAMRRRTLWLSLIPIAIGAIVVVTAYLGVQDARERRDALLTELDELFARRDQLQEELQQQKAVVEHVREKLPETERKAVELVQTGLDAYNSKDYDTAVTRLESAVAENPNMAEAHFRLGLSLWRTGQQKEALKEVQAAFKIDPSYEERARKDRRFKELWDYSYVVEGEKSAATAPEATAIKEALGNARTGDFGKAVESYDKALETNPENARVHGWKGYSLYRKGDYKAAISSYEECLAADPSLAECHYNMGLALWAVGDKRGAQASFEKTWSLDPSFLGKARQDPAFRKIAIELDPRTLLRKEGGRSGGG